ncbi:hypothetical protein [Acidovorax sp.]|uniref:hypothetical protein n=1 Tax=Acidovorax sp. TaxID=1872122 RepID=UPI003D063D93
MHSNTLTAAIQQRRVVVLSYHGYTRTVEPHCVGRGSDGTEKLRCWQTSGGSDSGERQGWKLLNVNEIHGAATTEATFPSARTGYARGDKAMRQIFAQL